MDGEILSASKHKPCAGLSALATPTRLGVQKVSSLWRRLIIGGAQKSLLQCSLSELSPALRRVRSDRWPG